MTLVAQDVDIAAALALVAELGWQIDHTCTALRQPAVAITSLHDVGADATPEFLGNYGRAV